jgi:predicted esterase
MEPIREFNVPAATHGRVLVAESREAGPLWLLAGFHGYAQTADDMMTMLGDVNEAASWTIMSVQGLHRFYRGRSDVTVASWMTRQDRELLIGDNVAYVDAAVAQVVGARAIERLVVCGFSQGVAMAFRAGLLGARKADAVLALGGDVPPELLVGGPMTFPRVLLARGARDEWYTEAKLQADEAALRAHGAHVDTLTFDGAHQWHRDFGARATEILRAL